ncbi:hypothetical protein B0H66DRAFT_164059 [Apodospora peruviana]|uniref:Uncharacterized protein n=1 Tax=Apodospora peruviana TaxID=516989 RepID=A0AAE0IK68_9PEZI|nr:hypothetical protein B0H66DRAFT_164059 [Apodospora peruviana]
MRWTGEQLTVGRGGCVGSGRGPGFLTHRAPARSIHTCPAAHCTGATRGACGQDKGRKRVDVESGRMSGRDRGDEGDAAKQQMGDGQAGETRTCGCTLSTMRHPSIPPFVAAPKINGERRRMGTRCQRHRRRRRLACCLFTVASLSLLSSARGRPRENLLHVTFDPRSRGRVTVRLCRLPEWCFCADAAPGSSLLTGSQAHSPPQVVDSGTNTPH